MTRLHTLVLILALTGTSAFADEANDEAEEAAAEKVCVNKRNITSFDAIDDQHLYIRASGQRHFLFTMWRRCFGLRGAQGIGIKDTMSRVCSNSFGEVVYRDMGRGLTSCQIGTIETVASKDDAKGLVEDRKQAKREEQTDN